MTVESAAPEAKVSVRATACPVNYVLEILSAKWTTEILRELFLQPTRTRRFLHLIPGLNMKTLRERLKLMEDLGIVNRTVYADLPLRVEYSLTDKGRELQGALDTLKDIGTKWLEFSCTCSFEKNEDGSCKTIDCPSRGNHRRERSCSDDN